MSQKFASTLADQIGIQIYDQIQIQRNCSKVKLRRAVSIRLGLKGGKIAQNIAKNHVHACLPNMHPTIWSGFNSGNLVKVETASYSFVRVWLKDAETRSQHRESWHALLFFKCAFKYMIKFYSKKLVKSETLLCTFLCVPLKWLSKSTFKFDF